jgi:hypothetical protein
MNAKIKFGMELEANFITARGIIQGTSRPYYTPAEWDYQSDPTTGTELRTPVFDSITNAKKELKKLTEWVQANNGVALHFKSNKYHNSVGGHIHISVWTRNGSSNSLSNVTYDIAKKVAKKVYRFLPYMYFINANNFYNNYLSFRMGYRPYSPYLDGYLDFDYLDEGRRMEVHLSEHNTLEFRMFDANIPQIQLTLVWLLRKIITNKNIEEITREEFQEVRGKRQTILFYPYDLKNLIYFREKFNEIKGFIKHKEIRNILLLSFSYLTNFAKFVEKYDYGLSLSAMNYELNVNLSGMKKKIWDEINSSKIDNFEDIYNKIVITPEAYIISRIQNFHFDNNNDNDIIISEETIRSAEYVINLFDSIPDIINTKELRLIKKTTGLTKRDLEAIFAYRLPKWYRLSSLTEEQLTFVSQLTGRGIKELFDMEDRVYTLLNNEKIYGVIFYKRNDNAVTAVFPIILNKEKLLESFVKFIKKTEGIREEVKILV